MGEEEGGVAGVDEEQVVEVMRDQELDRLPLRYVDFLKLMGKQAGRLLEGTDAFYPGILGLKQDAMELLAECGQSELLESESLVFAMHQGYQVYWLAGVDDDDPPVFMYQEGDETISAQWDSFSSFLLDQFSRVVTRGRHGESMRHDPAEGAST